MFEDKKEYDILITKTLPFIPNFGWSIFDKVSTWSLRAFSMAILASIACFNFLSTALEFSDT